MGTLDVCSAKEQFHFLIKQLRTSQLPQFAIWLDLKLAEYKILGEITTDREVEDDSLSYPTWISSSLRQHLSFLFKDQPLKHVDKPTVRLKASASPVSEEGVWSVQRDHRSDPLPPPPPDVHRSPPVETQLTDTRVLEHRMSPTHLSRDYLSNVNSRLKQTLTEEAHAQQPTVFPPKVYEVIEDEVEAHTAPTGTGSESFNDGSRSLPRHLAHVEGSFHLPPTDPPAPTKFSQEYHSHSDSVMPDEKVTAQPSVSAFTSEIVTSSPCERLVQPSKQENEDLVVKVEGGLYPSTQQQNFMSREQASVLEDQMKELIFKQRLQSPGMDDVASKEERNRFRKNLYMRKYRERKKCDPVYRERERIRLQKYRKRFKTSEMPDSESLCDDEKPPISESGT